MSILTFLQVFGFLCLYFSVPAALPALFPCSFSYPAAAVICAAGVWMACVLHSSLHGKLRLICCAIPLLTLLLCRNVMDVLVSIPPILYALIVILRCMYSLEYYTFRGRTRTVSICWCGFYVVLLLMQFFEAIVRDGMGTIRYLEPLLLGIIYFVCSIILLRCLRLSESDGAGRSLNRRQLLAVTVSGGSVIGAIVALERIAQRYSSNLSRVLERTFTYILGILVYPIELLARWIQASDTSEFANQLAQASQEPKPSYPMPPSDPNYTLPPEQSVRTGFPWWAAILMLLVLCAILLFTVRLFSGRNQTGQVEEVRNKLPKAQRTASKGRRSNRERIRQHYRNYLRGQRKAGVRILRCDTSADIMAKQPDDFDRRAAEQLREVYIKARYYEKTEPDAESVREMAAAERKLRRHSEA